MTFLSQRQNFRLNTRYHIIENNVIRLIIGIVTLLFIQPCSVFAQEILHTAICHGVIKDAETGQGLSGITVYVSNS